MFIFFLSNTFYCFHNEQSCAYFRQLKVHNLFYIYIIIEKNLYNFFVHFYKIFVNKKNYKIKCKKLLNFSNEKITNILKIIYK